MFVRDPDDAGQRTRFTRRALLLGGLQVAGLGLIAGRLYQLQVMEQRRYHLLAEDNRIAAQVTAPERGRILDRQGLVLADNVQAYRVFVVPALAEDLRRTLGRLARLIHLPADEQERLLARARRQPRNQPLVVSSDLSFEQVAEVGLALPQLPGVDLDITWRRRTFHGRDIGLVTGIVGAIERPGLDDDPVLRLPGFRVGKSGVERAMEATLRGRAGQIRHEVDARGRIVRVLEQARPEHGRDVQITIDVELQQAVMTRLRRERRASAVVLDVATGEVLVLATQPAEDPMELTSFDWQQAIRTADDPLLNRAIQGLYPPGSTFKMVTALAALDAGRIDLRERIDCEGEYRYADQVYRCWRRRGHGRCDLHRALRESCDTYFYEIARRTGIEALAAMAVKLGLGQTWDAGIALQRAGVVPTPDWKRARFGRPWHGGETIHAGIGQGYVTATPLQLAVMTARLASGRQVVPTLRRTGPVLPDPSLIALRPGILEAVRRGMVAAVNEEGGTGTNGRLDGTAFDHIRVAGKTGTAQVHRASSDRAAAELEWSQRDHALFVGYAPAERPRFAVAAVVEHGGSGGGAAAPLARDALELVFRHEPRLRAAPNLSLRPAERAQAGGLTARLAT